jgi:hypothetical protein
MLTRSLLTSALPKTRRRTPRRVPSLRPVVQRLGISRIRSLIVQDRVDAHRTRCAERHLYGRRDA